MWCCEAAGHVRRRSNGVDGASASDVLSISVALVRLSVRRRSGWRRLSYGVEVELGREHGSRAGHGYSLSVRVSRAPAVVVSDGRSSPVALLLAQSRPRQCCGDGALCTRVLLPSSEGLLLLAGLGGLVRALERFLVLPCVNEMTNDDRLQSHFAFARVVGRAKYQAAREQPAGAAAKKGFPGFKRHVEASSGRRARGVGF